MLTQRLTLTLPDTSYYSEIVGSGARPFDNVPGRGLVAVVRRRSSRRLRAKISKSPTMTRHRSAC